MYACKLLYKSKLDNYQTGLGPNSNANLRQDSNRAMLQAESVLSTITELLVLERGLELYPLSSTYNL